MTAKNNHSPANTSHDAYRIFIRYSNLVFFLVISILLVVGVWLLFTVINNSHNAASSSPEVLNASFDKKTIDRLNKLSTGGFTHTSVDPAATNPFVER